MLIHVGWIENSLFISGYIMGRVNHEEENIISGEIKPRRIKSEGNSCPGGKFWRKNYQEERVWGKDGVKPATSVCHRALRQGILYTLFI